MLLLRPLALACGMLQLLSPNNTLSTNNSLGLHRQDMVTDGSPVLNVSNKRDSGLEGATQKDSQGVTVQFVPVALSVWHIGPSVQAIGHHVIDTVHNAVASALCKLGIYCGVPAPVRSPASDSVPSHPASSPIKSASSFSEPVWASGYSYSNLRLALGHWFSGKSSLISFLCALDINVRRCSVFGLRWCQVGNKHAPNARAGPPPNTCTLPELDRCGVGARYLEPIPLVIVLRSSPGHQFVLRDVLTVGIFMVAFTLLVICLARPGPRSKLSFTLWWLISSFIYGISWIPSSLCFILFLPFLIVEVLSDGLLSLTSLAAQVIWLPRSALDDETAKKCYDEIIKIGLPAPWTRIFEMPRIKMVVEPRESAGENTLIAPAAFRGTPAGSMAAETAVTGANSAQPATLVPTIVMPTPVEPELVHTESTRCTLPPAPATLIVPGPLIEPAAAYPTVFGPSSTETIYSESEIKGRGLSDRGEDEQEFKIIIKICPAKPTDPEFALGQNWKPGHNTPAELSNIRVAAASIEALAEHGVGVPTVNAIPSHAATLAGEGDEHEEPSSGTPMLVSTSIGVISTPVSTIPDEVERRAQAKAYPYPGTSAIGPTSTLASTAPGDTSQLALIRPVATRPLPGLIDASDGKDDEDEVEIEYVDEDAEKGKGYEPDTEYDQHDEDEDEDEIEETKHYNDEDNGFECGRCYYIKLAMAACEEIKCAPAARTESAPPQPAPPVAISGVAPSAATSYIEASASVETSINRNVQPDFVNPVAFCPILAPTSSFSTGFKHRRVKSAPTQLAFFHSDSICTTSPVDAIPSGISIGTTTEDETKSSNGVAVSASATVSSRKDNGNDKEHMEDEEHEDGQATTRDICAKTVVVAPLVPAEVMTDAPPVTGPPTEVADNENAESNPDSNVVSMIPAADIALAGEAQDEDKIEGDGTSEESSDDEEFIDYMCKMIEAAVPMAEPSFIKSTLAETVPDAARATPASPVAVEVPCVAAAVREDPRSEACSSNGMVVPHIVVVPSTPPASPAATPGSSSTLATTAIVPTAPSKAPLSSKEKDDIFAALEEEEEDLAQQAKRTTKFLWDRWRSRI